MKSEHRRQHSWSGRVRQNKSIKFSKVKIHLTSFPVNWVAMHGKYIIEHGDALQVVAKQVDGRNLAVHTVHQLSR